MRFSTRTNAIGVFLLASPMAFAQAPASAGPGRIICKTATKCQLGIGEPASLKFQIDVSALPDADRDRLKKQCTANGETPCVVTVSGTEMDDAMKVKAAKITWFN